MTARLNEALRELARRWDEQEALTLGEHATQARCADQLRALLAAAPEAPDEGRPDKCMVCDEYAEVFKLCILHAPDPLGLRAAPASPEPRPDPGEQYLAALRRVGASPRVMAAAEAAVAEHRAASPEPRPPNPATPCGQPGRAHHFLKGRCVYCQAASPEPEGERTGGCQHTNTTGTLNGSTGAAHWRCNQCGLTWPPGPLGASPSSTAPRIPEEPATYPPADPDAMDLPAPSPAPRMPPGADVSLDFTCSACKNPLHGDDPCPPMPSGAAAEVARLRACLAESERQFQAQVDRVAEVMAEVERLRAEVERHDRLRRSEVESADRAWNRAAAAEAERDAAIRERDEARKWLETERYEGQRDRDSAHKTLASLRSRLEEAERLLRGIEWRVPGIYEGLCPVCGHDGPPHRYGCALAAFLAPDPKEGA